MGFFRKLFNRFKLTPEQKHIKRSLEDPQYREDFHGQMEEGRKISQESRKKVEEVTGMDVIGILKGDYKKKKDDGTTK